MTIAQNRVEACSIIAAATFLNTVFVPLFFPDVISHGRHLGISSSTLGFMILVNSVGYVSSNVISVLCLVLNIWLRVQLRTRIDRQFVINLVLMPIPIVFFLTDLPTIVFGGIPGLLLELWR